MHGPEEAILYLLSGAAVPATGWAIKRLTDRRAGRRTLRQNVESLVTWVKGEKPTDFNKTPPPGADDRIKTLEHGQTAILTKLGGLETHAEQLSNNGGSSMKDSLDYLLTRERKREEAEKAVAAITTAQGAHPAPTTVVVGHNTEAPSA